MKHKFINKCPDYESYRALRVKSMFNPERGDSVEITVETPDTDGWNIGVIVGPSGCGKTTAAKQIFGSDSFFRPEWTGGTVYKLDDGWDTGKVIIQEVVPILPAATPRDL